MSFVIGVVLVETFQLSDAGLPVDLLNMASRQTWEEAGRPAPPEALDMTVHWIAETLEPSVSSAGIKILPTCTFDTAPKLDMVFIPGPLMSYVAPASTAAYIKRAVEEANVVMTVCTGSFVLAQLGLLDGKRASINGVVQDTVGKRYPRVQWQNQSRWTADGKFWTGGGVIEGTSMMAAFMKSGYLGNLSSLTDTSAVVLAFEPQTQERDPSYVWPQL